MKRTKAIIQHPSNLGIAYGDAKVFQINTRNLSYKDAHLIFYKNTSLSESNKNRQMIQ